MFEQVSSCFSARCRSWHEMPAIQSSNLNRLAVLVAVVVVTLAATVGLATWTTASADAAPVLGVNIPNPFDQSEVAEVEQLGPKRVRAFIHPSILQPQPFGALDAGWSSGYRSFVDRMAA